ncbi:MAG: sn-glycerol-3-phosphate ABC transporter ATP-binding protein UgpC [Deltaproteobacteria bacterium]|nr:sn-glycerol-3-phosphate ABC transporter ATP-binding protein UgpC [Deltaproteobacteria bacterium]
MATLQLSKIQKSFGRTEVLRDVELQIADGEFVVLVGPSGCGKSTLLRCIAGLETISSGELQIGERVVNDVAPKDRDIAMVFQSYALYPHMKVRENLAFGLKMRGMPAGEIAERVGEAASVLGLEALLDRFPKQLSGGQRQRVAMGRALVRHPSVYLFDEPLSNLDAALRVQMRAELARLHQRTRTTMIYVTHDQVEAMTLADRIVVLEGGIVQQVGPPLTLYAEPVNKFVAGFIGSPAMNFLPAQMLGEDEAEGRGWVEVLGARLLLPAGRKLAAVGQRLELGIRPEHLVVQPGEEGDLSGRVEVVEPMGFEMHLHLRLLPGAGEEEGPIVVVRAEAAKVGAVAPGDLRGLDLPPEHLHLFDAGSGEAIR